MAIEDFFNNINSIISDWKNTVFTFKPKTYVPGLDDTNLTYGNGEEKKGIEINTCVLFVDIRDSVQLTKDKQIRTMGKIYSVFTHCVLLAAQYVGGNVRNIIGDRVMVVFPQDDCYRKAVNCAITINHIASMINKKFDNFGFKCGIGVDYGKLSVMKVGIQKKGAENDDNKGLVWVGDPANLASRLTDCANKEFTDTNYSIHGEFYEYNPFYHASSSSYFLGLNRPSGYYLNTKEYTAEEFASEIKLSQDRLVLSSCSNVYSIEKKEQKYKYASILLSDKVYQEFAKADPNRSSIKEGLWKKQTRKIKDIDYDVWGGDIKWVLNK